MTPTAPRGQPAIIQGGMGVGVSGWRLARAVASSGHLGVVSGVGLDTQLARRLQLGDPGGHLRRGLARFPFAGVAEQILERYYVPGGAGTRQPFRLVSLGSLRPATASVQLVVAANFVEVFLAKEGHGGAVGINYLEKLQMATPAAVYGAMLAGVDYVLVGAGIPAEIPGLLNSFAAGRSGSVTVGMHDSSEAQARVVVDPASVFGASAEMPRPRFLAVISSHILAGYLARDERTRPDGYVVEAPEAGGHNAPPRGPLVLDDAGEPVYGPRDTVDFDKIAALGLPFWLAGGQVGPGKLDDSRARGAAGIQVGSAFALCEESAMDPSLKRELIDRWFAGTLRIRTDTVASPTGFPLKVAQLPETVGEQPVYEQRVRNCDIGYLRVPYRQADGRIGYRCPAEPIGTYIRKGGQAGDAVGRRCLCNGLISTIGLGQRRRGRPSEPPLVTIGQDLSFLHHLASSPSRCYTAADVIAYLLRPGPRDGAQG
ncbi:MAG: nitronate monooxygenase [Actinomycetota bacterium]|nr:nitronate monooxygenase [Actinomycetota bacterium]